MASGHPHPASTSPKSAGRQKQPIGSFGVSDEGSRARHLANEISLRSNHLAESMIGPPANRRQTRWLIMIARSARSTRSALLSQEFMVTGSGIPSPLIPVIF